MAFYASIRNRFGTSPSLTKIEYQIAALRFIFAHQHVVLFQFLDAFQVCLAPVQIKVNQFDEIFVVLLLQLRLSTGPDAMLHDDIDHVQQTVADAIRM